MSLAKKKKKIISPGILISLTGVNICMFIKFLVFINTFEKVSMTYLLGTSCNLIALG